MLQEDTFSILIAGSLFKTRFFREQHLSRPQQNSNAATEVLFDIPEKPNQYEEYILTFSSDRFWSIDLAIKKNVEEGLENTK